MAMQFFLLTISFAMLSILHLVLDYSTVRSSAYAFDMIEWEWAKPGLLSWG